MRISAYLGILLAAATASASPLAFQPLPRADPLPATTIFKVPATSAWVENLAVSSTNGEVVVTLMTSGELWLVDPKSKNGTMLFKVPAPHTAISGITEYTPDKYAMLVGQLRAQAEGTWEVWNADLTTTPPTFQSVAKYNGASNSSGFLNGVDAMDNGVVVIADSGKGAVYSLNMTTGVSTTAALDTETMGPPAGQTVGIDGVRYKEGYVYFTNILKSTFCRVCHYPVRLRFTNSN
jgi:hypothetical protein